MSRNLIINDSVMNTKFPPNENWISQVSEIIINQIIKWWEKFKIKNNDKISVIFLAWAPWAGKTEFIKSLPKNLDFFFVDIDSYRNYFHWYKWSNAQEYQNAMSGVVNLVLKYCFQNDIKFILDGTFKSLVHAKRNIENCNRKKRKMEIYFIFQDPYISYYYTYLRELNEERNVPTDKFIECFYNSIKNIFIVKEKNKLLKLYICEKDDNSSNLFWKKEYNIYEEINDLTKFCNFYKIGYNWSEFTNKPILENGLVNFKKFLSWISPLLRWYLFLKKTLWQKKQKDL